MYKPGQRRHRLSQRTGFDASVLSTKRIKTMEAGLPTAAVRQLDTRERVDTRRSIAFRSGDYSQNLASSPVSCMGGYQIDTVPMECRDTESYLGACKDSSALMTRLLFHMKLLQSASHKQWQCVTS